MEVNMEINTKYIISSKELSLNVPLIKKKLEQQDKIVVFEDNMPQFIILPVSATEADEPMKIGEYVQTAMRGLFADNLISEEEIERLLTPEYSKSLFNLNFPILKEVDAGKPLTDQKRDSKGYNRYYNFTLLAFGKQYLLCSQWLDKHYDGFENWYQTIGVSHE